MYKQQKSLLFILFLPSLSIWLGSGRCHGKSVYAGENSPYISQSLVSKSFIGALIGVTTVAVIGKDARRQAKKAAIAGKAHGVIRNLIKITQEGVNLFQGGFIGVCLSLYQQAPNMNDIFNNTVENVSKDMRSAATREGIRGAIYGATEGALICALLSIMIGVVESLLVGVHVIISVIQALFISICAVIGVSMYIGLCIGEDQEIEDDEIISIGVFIGGVVGAVFYCLSALSDNPQRPIYPYKHLLQRPLSDILKKKKIP